jgi:hypothetical protein
LVIRDFDFDSSEESFAQRRKEEKAEARKVQAAFNALRASSVSLRLCGKGFKS